MTDEANTAAASADAHPSQVIEHREADANAQGRGVDLPQAEPAKEEAKPLSTRDAIAKAFDEAEARSKADAEKAEKPKDDKAEAKAEAKPEEKAEDKPAKPRADDGKFAKAENTEEQPKAKAEDDKSAPEKAAAGQGGDDARQSEGRKHAEPPARFLPEARTKWANVPNEVKAEVHRVSQEYENELSEHKAFREELREYEDLAKKHNVTIKGSLDRYVAADRMLNEDFGKGVAGLMKMYGHPPAQAIAMVLRAVGVTPEQYAQQVLKNPQAHQVPAPRPAPQQQQQSPEIAALKQQVAALEGRLASTSVQPIIEQFKASRPDYPDLEPQIAKILQSKVVEQMYGTGLSPEQKLEQAYRMAGGQGPSSQSAAPAPAAHSQAETPARPDPDPDGQKSIKGAPSSGQTGEPKRKFKSNRAALEAAFDAVR